MGDRPGRALTQDLSALQTDAQRVATLLKAMSNPARLMILCQLSEREKSVGELEEAVGLSQSGTSQRLAILRRERIIASRRDGQTIYYAIESTEAAAVMRTLYDLFCGKRSQKSRTRSRARSTSAREAGDR